MFESKSQRSVVEDTTFGCVSNVIKIHFKNIAISGLWIVSLNITRRKHPNLSYLVFPKYQQNTMLLMPILPNY
jgi:hypothetical protein